VEPGPRNEGSRFVVELRRASPEANVDDGTDIDEAEHT
jgi:hypothetical protein